MADALPCAVPGFARRCQLVSLPRPFPQPARYCLSFTAAGLKPELAPSSQQKVRSALLQMLRDAGLLAGKAGKGGTLGTVQRPFLSPQVQEVVASDDPALLAGFLHHAPAKPGKSRKAAASAQTPTRPAAKPAPTTAAKSAANAASKPTAKPKPKAAAKPAAKKAAPARRSKA